MFATDSCVGEKACYEGFSRKQTVGLSFTGQQEDGSACRGELACAKTSGSVGSNTCNGLSSCQDAKAQKYYDGSCQGQYSCAKLDSGSRVDLGASTNGGEDGFCCIGTAACYAGMYLPFNLYLWLVVVALNCWWNTEKNSHSHCFLLTLSLPFFRY